MSLLDSLRAQIAVSGPLTVAQYMSACLFDPRGGYYATRPRLGEQGDFITAPMVSQMFGELIGLWAAQVWSAMGRPGRVRLVEVGPGDGTLIVDALRAARVAPGFLDAAELVLVEPSIPLRAIQAQRLGSSAVSAQWLTEIGRLAPGAPIILIANEVLDCLPARQFVRTASGWAERVIVNDADGGLAFSLTPTAPRSEAARPGEVVEVSAAQSAFGSTVGALVSRDGGAALLIDYGRDKPGSGDTLQALTNHCKVDPLACPGEADLTVHADFPAVLAAARDAGASAPPPLHQAEFLRRLGVEQRARALCAARPDQAATVGRQLHRLTATDQMGELFKVAVVHSPAGLSIPAFEEA